MMYTNIRPRFWSKCLIIILNILQDPLIMHGNNQVYMLWILGYIAGIQSHIYTITIYQAHANILT